MLGTRNLQSSTVDQTLIAEDEAHPVYRHDKHNGLLDANSVALYVGDSSEPMIVDATNTVTLGRASPNSVYQPLVDLTRYGAHERGVSRLHASIQRSGEQFMVTDLHSSNGTWLNGTRLEPDVPQLLRSGDRLKLSVMRIGIFFEER